MRREKSQSKGNITEDIVQSTENMRMEKSQSKGK
jgi:hypothetical protein